MKKVVHIITLLEFGGAQGNTIHTVKNLDPRRFEAHLWSGRGAYWDDRAVSDIPASRRRFLRHLVRPVSPIHDVLAIFEMTAALRTLAPDIVHTHSSKAGILGRIAARLAGVPVIIHTYHGFGFTDRQNPIVRAIYLALDRWTSGFSDAVVFVSESNRATAKRERIGDPSSHHLIRSGVPLNAIRDAMKHADAAWLEAEFPIPGMSKLVTTIGAFKPQKNLTDFLEVASRVLERLPDVHFLLLGDGVGRAALQAKAKALGIEKKVSMPGWREDATKVLGLSDLFVMTSLWEGLPRSLVEAMTLGIPSVCYETDGVTDLLRKGGGVAIRQGDVTAAADAICRLLTDGKEWKRLSAQARELITEDFDIDVMVRQQEALYERLPAARPT